jgi:hypothetical protein
MIAEDWKIIALPFLHSSEEIWDLLPCSAREFSWEQERAPFADALLQPANQVIVVAENVSSEPKMFAADLVCIAR